MRQRPINLKLLSLSFPIPAIVSIIHRLTGLLLIVFIPILLFILQESLSSALAFEKLKNVFNEPIFRLCLWVMLSALGYHLIAGIRHILMDMHLGDSLWAGRLSAKITIFLALGLTVALAFWMV